MTQDRITPSAEVFRALVTSLEAALAADPTWIEQAKAALLAAAPAAPFEGGVEPSSTGAQDGATPMDTQRLRHRLMEIAYARHDYDAVPFEQIRRDCLEASKCIDQLERELAAPAAPARHRTWLCPRSDCQAGVCKHWPCEIPPAEGGVEPSSTGGAAPAAPEKAQPVAGNWAYLSTDNAIYCDDFSSDARLMLIGDFATESERTKYGDRIAAMLNAATVAHVAVAATQPLGASTSPTSVTTAGANQPLRPSKEA